MLEKLSVKTTDIQLTVIEEEKHVGLNQLKTSTDFQYLS